MIMSFAVKRMRMKSVDRKTVRQKEKRETDLFMAGLLCISLCRVIHFTCKCVGMCVYVRTVCFNSEVIFNYCTFSPMKLKS